MMLANRSTTILSQNGNSAYRDTTHTLAHMIAFKVTTDKASARVIALLSC